MGFRLGGKFKLPNWKLYIFCPNQLVNLKNKSKIHRNRRSPVPEVLDEPQTHPPDRISDLRPQEFDRVLLRIDLSLDSLENGVHEGIEGRLRRVRLVLWALPVPRELRPQDRLCRLY